MRIVKNIVFFILFEVIFCTALAVILVFKGPFTNIRDTFVTTAMTTMHHQYLARIFLSDQEIKKIMDANQIQSPTELENTNDVVVNENSYTNMDKLQIINIKTNRYKGYLMVVNDPSRVKVGTDSNLAQNGLTLSRIVKKYNAAAGINAGGFTDIIHTGTQAQPEGMIIEDSKLLYADSSSSYNLIGFNQNNVLVVGNYSLAQIMKMNIRDAVSFGPSLIINGKAVINSGNGGHGIQPRSAIAQKKDGTILMLAIDGRQKDSVCATLKDVQDVLLKYGAYNAANLDGGSSTTMINGGQLVNSPCDILGERSIPSAFIVK